MALPDGLLDKVKNRLNITWDDDATNEKLSDIIADGMEYIDDKLGDTADYTEAGRPRMLLMEYSRYAWSDALDVFETNYLAHILAMQNKKAVADYEESLSS